LILDLDVIFNKDPIYIFKKYNNENKFYCLEESRTPPEIQLLICKPKGINGGQILLSSTIYQKLKKLYNNLLDERQIIKKKIEQLDGYHQDWIMNDLSDQYALTNLLHKRKINLSFFDVEDICFGPECQPSKIFHYFSSLNKNYLPQKFLQRN
jgi:hypothetical protein